MGDDRRPLEAKAMKTAKPLRPLEDPDPRSKFHRACINVFWWLVFVSLMALSCWLLFTGDMPVYIGILCSLFALVVWGMACIKMWTIHSAPPGYKFDAWVGERR